MMDRFVKIYGLPATCTNWVSLVLEKNCDVKCLSMILGSKHNDYVAPQAWLDDRTQQNQWSHGLGSTITREQLQQTIKANLLQFVICTKNIYATIVSQMANSGVPLDRQNDFDTKLRERCHICCDALRSWLPCIKRGWTIRHEDIMCDYGIRTVSELQANLKLPQRLDTPTLWLPRQKLQAKMDDGVVMFSQEHIAARRMWYLSDAYMLQLSNRAVDTIDDETDWTVMAEYGYEKSAVHSHVMKQLVEQEGTS